MSNIGVNDTKRGTVKMSKVHETAHNRWKSMLRRCYNQTDKKYPTYGGVGVYVCDEWLLFSNYLQWFLDNYIDGCEVDKDILGIVDEQGNKYYSPKTCIFVSKKDNIVEGNYRRKGEQVRTMEYYEVHSVLRDTFVKKCKKWGWIFGDFESFYVGNSRGGKKLFVYFHKNSQGIRPKPIFLECKRVMIENSDLSIYESRLTTKGVFKKICERHGCIYEDYDWLPSEYKKGTQRLGNFIHKDKLRG